MKFNIADKIALPEDAVTQTFGFFGRKGSGKTYAAGVLAESFLSADIQVVVLDPVGNWYGLRLSKTGKSESPFHIPILGGERGDIPLQTTGGALVAQTIVDTGTSVVLDVSSFRKAERKRFMADFAEELFHRKKTNRSPMHLIIEEAQLFAPQIAKGEERMLGAIEDLVRLGRNYGIGCSMISQRPQSINTEVRNQCEPLIVFQLVAHHEREAVAKWMEHMGVNAELAELSKLKTGECFFWSPAWLEKFVRTRFKEKVSFDASSTPTAGSHQKRPGKLKSLDLGKLQSAMAATIEDAKANDPAELKKQIADMKRQVAAKPAAAPDAKATERAVASAVAERDRFWKAEVAKAEKAHGSLAKRLRGVKPLAESLLQLSTLNGDSTIAVGVPPTVAMPAVAATHRQTPRPAAVRRETPVVAGDTQLGKAERLILRSFYWTRDEQATPAKIGFYAGYSHKSGSFANTLSQLRTKGLLSDWQITGEGETAAAEFAEAKPTGAELREWLRPKLSKCENEILDVLMDHPGVKLTAEDIATSTPSQYSHSSGSFANAMARLRSLEAAEGYGPQGVKAADVFFE